MPTQVMTPTQKQLFKLLSEIDDICKRHDIEYFLDQGTILGVVRHGGFLPWDNDLDICMTEPNYDKFVAACQNELDPKTRCFCDNRRNREFPTVFGHYVDTTCCRMTDRTPFWDYYVGQTIDVFCLVELPGNPVEKKRLANLYFAYDEYVNQSFNHYKRKTEEIARIYHELYEREAKIGRDAVLAECEGQLFGHHYDDCTTLMCTSARMHWNTFLPKSIYENPRMVEWNGRQFRIPGDWYTMMTINYGDRFYEVPRNPIIHSEMSHTGLPVQPYVDDFMATVDKKKLLSDRLEAKNRAFERGLILNRLNTPLFAGLGTLMSYELDQRIKAEGVDLMDLVNENTLETAARLETILGDYLTKQKHGSIQYWRCHFGHSDAADCAIMQVLLLNYGNVQGMIRLMRVRQENDLPITPEMSELLDAGMHFRRMKKHWYYDELELGCQEEEWAWDNLPHFDELRIWHALYNFYGRCLGGVKNVAKLTEAPDAEQLEACLDEAQALREELPSSDLVAKLLADLHLVLGRRDEALALYAWIEATSNNGFVLRQTANVFEAATEEEVAHARESIELPAPTKKKGSAIPRFKDYQKHLLQLARELDETCRELDVPYALCTHDAAWARKRKKLYGSQYGIHVMMRAPHALKVKQALLARGLANRACEDLSTNPELPFNQIRYVDTATTLVDGNDPTPYKLLGAAITIHPLYTKKPGALQRRLEWGHALLKGGRKFGTMNDKRQRALDQVRSIEKTFGSGAVANYLYSRLAKNDAKASELYAFDAPNSKGSLVVEASMLDSATYAPFSGIELPLPHKLDDYLKRWCGIAWSNLDQKVWRPARANRVRCICSPDLGFEDALALMEAQGIDCRGAQKLGLEAFLWWQQELIPWGNVQRKGYARARMSRDRIDIYARLLPHAAELKAASDAGDTKKLEALLEEQNYLSLSKSFLSNWDLGLFVTPELFGYARQVWTANGQPKLADKVWAKVPQHHKDTDLASFLASYPRY